MKERQTKSKHYSDVIVDSETVGLVLVLLNLSVDFCHPPPLAEVDQAIRSIGEEVWVALLNEEDIAQVHS